jgi:protease I
VFGNGDRATQPDARDFPYSMRVGPNRTELKGGLRVADLNGKKVAFLATDMVEQVELTEPWKEVEEAGAQPELVSLEAGEIQGFDHYDKADTFSVDRTVGEVSADDYDALVIPGGVGNPDTMRTSDDAVRFVRDFVESGKPTAVICHGPWMLVEAEVASGRRLTSYGSIKTDVRNAGGNWVDEEVVVDGNLVTSRSPDDLPAFNRELLELLARTPVSATGS